MHTIIQVKKGLTVLGATWYKAEFVTPELKDHQMLEIDLLGKEMN